MPDNSLKRDTEMRNIRIAFTTIFVVAGAIAAVSQVNIKPAISAFEQGDYDSAIEQLEKTVAKYDRDVKTNYYLGASYVAARRNLSEGIKRLKYAQVKGFVANSNYYLGRAYQLIFEYEQSITAFNKFLKTAKDEALIARALQYREESNNSIALASKLFNVRVIDKYRVTRDSLLYVYNPSKEVGSVQRNGDFFESDIDPEGILYRTERGDAVYFSLPDGTEKAKLYKIEKLLDGWGDMVALQGLASEGNDMMPVMMTDGTTLYFSSDRPGGMGGLDIYRCTYDIESRSFTEPVNLGVPFNSAFDDFLFVGDEFRSRAWFASTRETGADSVMVYEILWDSSVIRSFAQSTNEIRQASLLPIDPTLSGMKDDVAVVGTETKLQHSITREERQFEFVVNDSLTYTRWEHFRSSGAMAAYRQGSTKQAERDSLSTLMAGKRKEFMQLDDDAARNELIADILKIERQTYTLDDEIEERMKVARRLEIDEIERLVAAGEYRSLSSIKVEQPEVTFDWGALLEPDMYEMYSDLPFSEIHMQYDSLYAAVFEQSDIDALMTADARYAWAGILMMESTKMQERSNNGETRKMMDLSGESVTLDAQGLAEWSVYLRQAALTLYNTSLETKFDIYDDRYNEAVDSEPEVDFSETDVYVKRAIRDFELTDGVDLSSGEVEYEKAGVLRKRGMASFNEAMERYAAHRDGSFPLPARSALPEPEGVSQGLEEEPVIAEATPEPEPEAMVECETPAAAELEPVAVTPAVAASTVMVGDATVSPVADKPVYRIQVGVFRNEPKYAAMSGLGAITKQELPERGLTKYFVGEYLLYNAALQQIDTVRSAGFNGAFIVAFYQGEQIKLSEAQKLE